MNLLRKISAVVCVSFLCILCGERKAAAQQVGIKTDALMWGALTPNLGFEVVTGEHTSFDFSLFGHYKPYGVNSAMFGLQPQFRYWFNGRPMTREYIGVGALLTTYDMTINRHVYDGDALGIGLTAGYVFSLGDRWNLELSGSFGLMYFQQKQYYINDNYDDYFLNEPSRVNGRGIKIFPVDLGVTFTYIIK